MTGPRFLSSDKKRQRHQITETRGNAMIRKGKPYYRDIRLKIKSFWAVKGWDADRLVLTRAPKEPAMSDENGI